MAKKHKIQTQQPDTSPHIHQRDKVKERLEIKELPWTDKQKEIINKGLDKNTNCIFIDGVWGTGKTAIITYITLKLLQSKKISSIKYIRNPLEASTSGKLGFIKGDISEKMAPYNEPFFAKLEEFISTAEINKLAEDERFVCLPLGFTRGLSWNCQAIIVDEAASFTFDDILLLLTRCGPFTKIFFIGDSLNQNDIGARSGFIKAFNLFSDEDSQNNGIFTYKLQNEEDILGLGLSDL